jgi:hypothetical protein
MTSRPMKIPQKYSNESKNETDDQIEADLYAECDVEMLLLERQFTEEELKKFIDRVSMRRVLKTQKNISKEFINEYILNPTYHANDSDEYLTWDDVFKYRPDLKKNKTITINQIKT